MHDETRTGAWPSVSLHAYNTEHRTGKMAADSFTFLQPRATEIESRPPRIAGVDEAGRGPLAGPVVVAAVVFDPARPRINGLADSKQLCPARREALYARIIERALAWRIEFVAVEVIDRINILQATLLGMQLAVEAVRDATDLARIDGNRVPPGLPCPAEPWIGGDARDRAIMAASILAKVARDRAMCAMHLEYPHYGFDVHKGYGTPAHLAALAVHGPCPQHRRSFAPVRSSAPITGPCGETGC